MVRDSSSSVLETGDSVPRVVSEFKEPARFSIPYSKREFRVPWIVGSEENVNDGVSSRGDVPDESSGQDDSREIKRFRNDF